VIQRVVDPGSEQAFDIREVEDHSAAIELFGFKRNLGEAVMPVRVRALPLVIEQTWP